MGNLNVLSCWWGEPGRKLKIGRGGGLNSTRRADPNIFRLALVNVLLHRYLDIPRRDLFLRVVFLVKFLGIAETQNLSTGVAREDAVWALGLERYHRDVPRTGAIRSRHTPARQAFERLELEYRRGRSYVIQRT
jgi:hypothetical protein